MKYDNRPSAARVNSEVYRKCGRVAVARDPYGKLLCRKCSGEFPYQGRTADLIIVDDPVNNQ